MKNSDDIILKKIKHLFEQDIQLAMIPAMTDTLAKLYSQLSFDRSYAPQELFPNINPDYKVTDKVIAMAEQLSEDARQPWAGTGEIKNGRHYASCRELFKNATGIDVGREYTYPNGMSSQEFQESFSATQLVKNISSSISLLAQAAPVITATAPIGLCHFAYSHKLFVEKEKPAAIRTLQNAYRQFWQANPNIVGHQDLKNLQDFDAIRNFLMGVSSEVPLDDIAAFLSSGSDQKMADELAKNTDRYKKEFNQSGLPPFFMTNKTWNKHIQPVLDRKKKRSKAKGIRLTLESQKATKPCARKNSLVHG